jgi:hypothetical protein
MKINKNSILSLCLLILPLISFLLLYGLNVGKIISSVIFPFTFIPTILLMPRSNGYARYYAFFISIFFLLIIAVFVDNWVLSTFNLEVSELWNEQVNLYWFFWFSILLPYTFFLVAIIYKVNTGNTKNALKLYLSAILLGFIFSLEDVLYYPLGMLHRPLDPLLNLEEWWNLEWSWLVQHSAILGRSIRTPELLLLCMGGVLISFIWVRGDLANWIRSLIKKPKTFDEREIQLNEENKEKQSFYNKYRNLLYVWFSLACIGIIIFLELYLIGWDWLRINGFEPLGIIFVITVGFMGLILAFLPQVNGQKKLLTRIFLLILLIYLLYAELDWWAVEEGFHNIPSDPLYVLQFNKYRIAMWLILIPMLIFILLAIFKMSSSEKVSYLPYCFVLSLLILYSGNDFLLINAIRGSIPSFWWWIHYSTIIGAFPALVIIFFVIVYIIYKRKQIEGELFKRKS